MHPAIATTGAREHDEGKVPGLRAQISAAHTILLRQHLVARIAHHRIGGFGVQFRMLEHGDLGDAGEGARLAPGKILQAPEIGHGFDAQYGCGIVALFLDQFADFGRGPARQFCHRRDDGFIHDVGFDLVVACFWRWRIPPIALLHGRDGWRCCYRRRCTAGELCIYRLGQQKSGPEGGRDRVHHSSFSIRIRREMATGP